MGQLTYSLNTLRASNRFKYNVDGYLIALECFNGKEQFEVQKLGHFNRNELRCCVGISHDQQQRESRVCEGIGLHECVMREITLFSEDVSHGSPAFFYCKGPHTSLRDGSRAARGKIISGILRGDPDVDGRIILRWIFRKWEGFWGLNGVGSG